MRVGVARAVITPPLGVSLAGSYHDRRAVRIHDELYARAFVVDDGAAQVAVVSCDLLGVHASTVAGARRLIEERCGIPGDHMLIAATHNHSGPLTRDPGAGGLVGETDEQYVGLLERQIASAVEVALSRRAEAQLRLSLGEERGVAFNRRFHMKEGPVRTNPGRENPEIVEAAGPVDPRVWTVTALAVEDGEAGRGGAVPRSDGPPDVAVLGMLVNFGLHPAIVAGTVIGGDFPAFLERGVQRMLGESTVLVFANAPCGDINHIDVSHGRRASGFAEAEWVGTILAAKVVKGACRLMPEMEIGEGGVAGGSPRVRGGRRGVELGLRRPSAERVAWAREAAGAKMSMAPGQGLEVVEAHRILALVDGVGWQGETKTTEVQALAVGEELAIVGLPGEVFVELGLALRERSPFKQTLVLGLANDSIGYVPTRRAYEEGGYEPTSSRLVAGSGERLVEEALVLLGTLK